MREAKKKKKKEVEESEKTRVEILCYGRMDGGNGEKDEATKGGKRT